MKFGEKEKKGIIILLALVYIYVFYEFNINNSIPNIKVNSDKIALVTAQVEQLKADFLDYDKKKRYYDRIVVANERYGDYISPNSDVIDSMEYMEKLKRLFNGKIKDVSLKKPEQITINDIHYYEFTTNFKANMQLSELNTLTDFLENNTKKVKVTSLDITQKKAEELEVLVENASGTKYPSIEQGDLEVLLSITMYSLEKGSSESLFELSRAKFEQLAAHDGIVLKDPKKTDIPEQKIIRVTDNSGGSEKLLPPIQKRRDMSILVNSYLSGGSNIIVTGFDQSKDEFFKSKSNSKQNITLKMNNFVYSVDVFENGLKKGSFSGNFLKRDVGIYVRATLPQIVENENLGADITVINDSEHSLAIIYEGEKSKIRVIDRNGNIINTKSSLEKIYML